MKDFSNFKNLEKKKNKFGWKNPSKNGNIFWMKIKNCKNSNIISIVTTLIFWYVKAKHKTNLNRKKLGQSQLKLYAIFGNY